MIFPKKCTEINAESNYISTCIKHLMRYITFLFKYKTILSMYVIYYTHLLRRPTIRTNIVDMSTNIDR